MSIKIIGEKEKITELSKIDTDYIDSFDTDKGTITLKANPLKSNGENLEHFTAFSVLAGHKATTVNAEKQETVISYLPYVHLVKMDVFYVTENIENADNKTVLGINEQENKEQDVAWVYTYIDEIDGHQVGEIVRNGENEPIYNKEDLPEGLIEHVKLTKVYSTLEGLHTDKTISKIQKEDRRFTVDLESWYSNEKTTSIGLLLDASGSMIFTSNPLEPININNLNLSEEQKTKLLTKALTTEKYPNNPTTEQWEEKIFLTEKELNQILNKNNTDNNPLSNSDYNYYIFEANAKVNEYVPLGYWDGSLGDDLYDSLIGYYEFNRGTYEDNRRDWLKNSITNAEASVVNQIETDEFNNAEDISFTIEEKPNDWSTDNRIKMKPQEGLTVKDLNKEDESLVGLGVLLDVKPTTNNFTISFTVQKAANTETDYDHVSGTQSQNYTDLLYVGPLNNIKSSNYYRVLRDGANEGTANKSTGNSSNRLKGYQNEIQSSNTATNINSVFNNENKIHTVTLVFKDGIVTSYLDGEKTGDQNDSPIELTDRNIVITGFDNNYDGALLYIDDVRVFDKALYEEDIVRIPNMSNEELEKIEKNKKYIACNTYGDHKEKIGLIDSSFLKTLREGIKGWYYITHTVSLQDHFFKEGIETQKELKGIPFNKKEGLTFTDEFTIPTGVEATLSNTKYTYTVPKDSSSLFYLDKNGYLCCFFAHGNEQEEIGSSFVYKKEDSDNIKLENLQHAIGNFASKLSEASPNSQVSAVRYNAQLNTEDYDYYEKFVILDWTNNPSAIQSMMSLNYGDGGTIKGTTSNPAFQNKEGIQQYNYTITGATSTYVGLKAFNQFLNPRVNEDSEKYLVIFTDGKDTSNIEQREEIDNIANELKEKGYTILGVMLTGGTVEYSEIEESEYQQAKQFLLSVVGTSDTTKEERENYFFSTAEIENEKNKTKANNDELSNIDTLTEIFTNHILKQVTGTLNSYTVQDYIDPRFNLISSTGKEYKLDANGIVTILDTNGSIYAQYNLKTGDIIENPNEIDLKPTKESSGKYYLDVKLSDDIDTSNAHLFFDEDNNMYFLKWVNQTIPGCIPNAKKLSVWNARFTIKAKDDVIGGNAVLTNGNKQKMNLVYHEKDTNASSGTNDDIKTDTNELPSKGFPRVTVNIPPYELKKEEFQTIYMGETLNYENIKKDMVKQVNEETKGTENENILYYWEYLDRYGKNSGKTANDYIEQLIKEGTLEVNYYYLPNKNNTNLTGNSEHEGDLLGVLKYTIKNTQSNDVEEVVQDKESRQLTLTVTYTAETTDNRISSNDTLIIDDNYNWNSEYKPVVGDELQGPEAVIVNNYQIDIVSGEIALQIVFDEPIVEIIDGHEIKYEIELYRNETELVGTFRAEYDGNSNITVDDNGNFVLTAKLEYEKEYMGNNGLPLGTYTLKNQRITAPDYIKFGGMNIVNDTNRYLNKLFELGTNRETPEKYLATFNNNTEIILGSEENGNSNVNKRFGLFETTPIAVFEMPTSGENSLVNICIITVICITAAIVLHQSDKERKRLI